MIYVQIASGFEVTSIFYLNKLGMLSFLKQVSLEANNKMYESDGILRVRNDKLK